MNVHDFTTPLSRAPSREHHHHRATHHTETMRARDDYLTGVLDALARNASTIQPHLDRAFFNRKRPIDIFAISDVHVDVPENARCVRERVDDILRRRRLDADDGRFRVVVVAGDAGTSERSVETCVGEFSRAFDCVCYLPAGNHELWCAGRGDEEEDEKDDASTSYPRDSLGKMWRLIDLCTELGAACAPIRIGGARVVPTYGWYDDAFAADPARRGVYSPLEARFDMACRWPTFINPPEDARNSRSPLIGDFMRDVNDGLFERFQHTRDGSSTNDDDVDLPSPKIPPRARRSPRGRLFRKDFPLALRRTKFNNHSINVESFPAYATSAILTRVTGAPGFVKHTCTPRTRVNPKLSMETRTPPRFAALACRQRKDFVSLKSIIIAVARVRRRLQLRRRRARVPTRRVRRSFVDTHRDADESRQSHARHPRAGDEDDDKDRERE